MDGLFHEDGLRGLPNDIKEKKKKVGWWVYWCRGEEGFLLFFMVFGKGREPPSSDSPQSKVVWRKDTGWLLGYLLAVGVVLVTCAISCPCWTTSTCWNSWVCLSWKGSCYYGRKELGKENRGLSVVNIACNSLMDIVILFLLLSSSPFRVFFFLILLLFGLLVICMSWS